MPEIGSSISVRLASLFSLVAFLVFSLISITLYWLLASELNLHQIDQIQSRMEDMRYMLKHSRPPGIAERMHAKIEALTPADGRTLYWMWSAEEEYRYGQDLDAVVALTEGRTDLIDWYSSERHVRVMSEDIAATEERPAVRLVVGMNARPFTQTLHHFALSLIALTVLGTSVVAVAGYYVARLGLMPVRRLSEEAHRIEPGNYAPRLKVTALPLELAYLGLSFNAALERLDAAYHQLETFNGNVAHEMRTPLANLIGQTQVALSRERSDIHLRGVLQSNLEELERLRAIVADMLFLARAEQGARASQLVVASLADEVAKTIDFLDMLLEEVSISVRVEGEAQTLIETSLFRRAIINLLQNAIEHSKAESEIVVNLDWHASQVLVTVSNVGPTIAPEQLPRLFDRFYRVEASRDRSGESHGLGLAIVKAVALMHKGRVFARSSNGHTSVGFSLGLVDETLSDAK